MNIDFKQALLTRTDVIAWHGLVVAHSPCSGRSGGVKGHILEHTGLLCTGIMVSAVEPDLKSKLMQGSEETYK